jgi:hypothetical protein
VPVTRRLIESAGDAQLLKAGASERLVWNVDPAWQLLFGPKSKISPSFADFAVAAQLDTETFDKIKLMAFLYPGNTASGIYTMASVTFNVARVTIPQWTEVDLTSVAGTLLPDGRFYAEVGIASLLGANLDGDTTLKITAVGVRQNKIYRKTIYANHLGVYDSVVRLRKDIQFLDLTKLDE